LSRAIARLLPAIVAVWIGVGTAWLWSQTYPGLARRYGVGAESAEVFSHRLESTLRLSLPD